MSLPLTEETKAGEWMFLATYWPTGGGRSLNLLSSGSMTRPDLRHSESSGLPSESVQVNAVPSQSWTSMPERALGPGAQGRRVLGLEEDAPDARDSFHVSLGRVKDGRDARAGSSGPPLSSATILVALCSFREYRFSGCSIA